MPESLTAPQQRLLAYYRRRIERGVKTPSLRQAAADLGISHTAVAGTLKLLERKGFLTRNGRYGRDIRLHDRGEMSISLHHGREIPIIGRVTAGLPLYAQQQWAGSVVVDAARFRHPRLFALHIVGDSMKAAGILDGDLAICEPRQFAENGEIVVVLIHEEETTVKRFFHRRDHIELRPENSAYPPMRYPLQAILIQGKVVGLHRGPDVMERI